MNILLLGKTGQLGWELERTLSPLGKLTALDYPDVDFTKPETLSDTVRNVAPDFIVNAVAYTQVDQAEREPERVRLINAIATGVLAEEAFHLNAGLIHYSTDYVFDGSKGSAYVESEFPNPLNIYGQTKLDGERAIQQVGGNYLILRTSWVYSIRQGGVVTKVLQWARQQTTLRMVTDQVGSPTYARMLAEVTGQLLACSQGSVEWLGAHRGLYHLAGSGAASRFEWAQEILNYDKNAHEHVVKEILPALTPEFPTLAQRPLFSALNCQLVTKTFQLTLPHWTTALRMCMDV